MTSGKESRSEREGVEERENEREIDKRIDIIADKQRNGGRQILQIEIQKE